jgi:CP family cyanate transporter-like MFS transporter
VQRAGTRAALVALFLAGLTFRPQIVGAGPLFPSIQHDLDVSHAVVGLLGTIPVLCMGLFAPPAALVVRRLGTRAGIGLSIAVIGIFGLLRAFVPGAALVVLVTLGVGVGMGVGGAIAPVAVKERFEKRSGFATGIYTTGIQVGSAVSSSVAVPLAHGLGGWRWSLGIFSAMTCALALAWGILMRGESAHARPVERPPMLPWRRPSAWLLVGTFALMASTYYGLTNWLSDSFVERGWSEGRAGWLIAVLNIAAVPGSLLIPWVSDHLGGRRPWLIGTGIAYLLASFGFVQLPGAAWLWSVCAGVASAGMFSLVLTLPLDIEHDARRVGALVGMMLGLGYAIGAASPLVLGAVRDATGSFTGSLWLIVAFSATLLAAVAAAPVRRPEAAVSARRTT